MIGILSNKLTTKFKQKLGLPFILIDDFDPKNPIDIDGLFIDWVSKISEHEGAWLKQASLLQTYIKSDIPIVIFDRSFSLTEKEVNWCSKFNTFLFEPAINSERFGFKYLPEWIDDTKIIVDHEHRKFDLVYSYYKLEYQIKGFEKWIQNYSRVFHDKKVAYDTMFISDFKKEEYRKDNLIFLNNRYPIYDKGNTTVAFDTDKAYKIGYLNPEYLYAMNMGCLPLLPIEHKYFHSMFNGLLIKDIKELDYFVSTMSKVKNVVIEEIFDKIEKEWPEFTIDYAINIIRECL